MKNRTDSNAGILILTLLFAFFAASCHRSVVKEEISASVESERQKAVNNEAVVVPDEKITGEDATAEDLKKTGNTEKEGASKFASVAGAEDLSKRATEAKSLYPIHFDFDKYTVKDIDKGQLAKDAEWLKLNPGVSIRIEGYADERGDSEYNLALGEKRAMSVKKYLEALGIGKERLATLSYGEERPVDPGHNEEAWAKNRRAEFNLQNAN